MEFSFDTFKRIHEAMEFIEEGKIDGLEVGRHDLTDGIFVNVSEYETKDTGLFESHRKYVDIHYVIDGAEMMEIADEKLLKITEEYSEEKDCLFGNAEGKGFLVREKQPFVVMPGEAHLPGLKAGEKKFIKKAVIKVLV